MSARVAQAYRRGLHTVLLIVAVIVNGGTFVLAGDRWYVALFCGVANVVLTKSIVRLYFDQVRAEVEQ